MMSQQFLRRLAEAEGVRNVDLHDCDKILRVVAEDVAVTDVAQIVFNAGYFCEELQ